MRISYIVRKVSLWLTRVVYERDEWDEWLEHVTDDLDIRVGWMFFMARGFVWLSRRVLWVLMVIGHAVSGVLLRQMEFDADRQETRLAGSECFESTTRRIHQLGAASQKSFSDLLVLFKQGRMGDNLPKLVMFNEMTMPARVKGELRKSLEESTTGLFDTHPSAKERIASSRQENAAGIFRLESPAAQLFVHFDALCKNITWDFYRDVTGVHIKPDDLESIDDLIAQRDSHGATT